MRRAALSHDCERLASSVELARRRALSRSGALATPSGGA
ncbi:Hypothetical protein A7982_03106 [Minicystis rosea]|nr:Hypothetical protein A7982_03106 [Minicystis rosea]